jgi:hypothetical protein
MQIFGINFPWKYIPVVILFLLVGALAFYYYQDGKKTEHLLAITNEQLQQANLELGRAKTTVTEQAKVHKAAMADMDKKIRAEIKARKALITLYAKLEADYKTKVEEVKALTKIIQDGKEIPLPKDSIFLCKDGKCTPIESMIYTYSDFRISIQGDAIQETLSYDLHQRFKVQFAETKLPSGGNNHYIKLYELDDKGNNVGELTITSFEVLKAEGFPDHFDWWNPKIDVGLWGGANTDLQGIWGGDIGISLMSYGKTDNDIAWKFIRFGFGATRFGGEISLSPVQFNIGSVLPLISNLWLTPIIGYDFGPDNFFGAAGLTVVF